MLTAFARKRGTIYVCDPNNLYAASFDGVDDYLLRGGTAVMKGWTRHVFSMWINIQAPYWPTTALRWFYGQGILNNNLEDFIRIYYQPSSTSNFIEFEFRHSGTSNTIRKQWALHTAANSPITGSTGSTNYWTASNANINKNSNGYVHLMFIYTPTSIGNATTNSEVECWWNGQQLTASFSSKLGTVISTGVSTTTQGVSINPSSLSTVNCTPMYMDQLAIFSAGAENILATNLGLTLSSNQDTVDMLYNGGCPRYLPIDGRYPAVWNFENNWDWDYSGTGGLWTTYNGPTFTSNHA